MFWVQADVESDDMLQDDDISPIYEVPDCPSLDANNAIYSGLPLCLDGEDGRAEEDVKCPDNAYGVMLVPDGAVNAYNEKVAAFKVCAWCPAGERWWLEHPGGEAMCALVGARASCFECRAKNTRTRTCTSFQPL